MQQSNIHLLSTRVLDDTLIRRAEESNITLECVSFIETKHLQSDALQQQLQSLADETVTAVFTSMNAVNAVASQLPVVPQWKIFCTGGVTKEYVIKYFGEASIAATAKNATVLAEKIIAANPSSPIIFFCGDQRLNDLPELLKANGKAIEEVIVYTTEETPVFIEKNYQGILFFSPSAVHSFFSLNTVPIEVVLFSIGQTTAATIQSYCTNKVVVSQWPGAESMIDLIIEYYEEQAAKGL
jgi:uroporphyrinogen-III synthase